MLLVINKISLMIPTVEAVTFLQLAESGCEVAMLCRCTYSCWFKVLL